MTEDDTQDDVDSTKDAEYRVTAENVEKAFGDNKVLRGVSFTVKRGTATAIIGPSGSGKTTLLRTLNALDRADSGVIRVDDVEIDFSTPVPKPEVRRFQSRSGFVFQGHNLFPHKTVLENVMLAPRRLKRLEADAARELGLAQLERVGLRHKADVRPATLSGGQQQRVAIARALAMAPQVMFFDEATSALDPELVKGILGLISDLGADGMTMVVVTHEMEFARSAADAVVFMDHGKVVESGPPEQVFEDAKTDRLRQFLSQVL